MNILWVVLGLTLLVIGGEYLVRSSVALSFKLNVSKLVIGMTVVSFATSAPELLVSLQAALDGAPDISLGNVIGSNIANIGLVLGVTAVISPLVVDKGFFKLNWPALMLFSIALLVFLSSNNELSQLEGGILLIGLILFLVVLIKSSRTNAKAELDEVDDTLQRASNFKIIIWLLIGGLALYFGSEWLVFGAKEMALSFGVSERVISVTMVAVGTSVPELAASVIAAMKKEKAISLGNLIGSNIFNIASVLGITALIKAIPVNDPAILSQDIYWMLGVSAVLLPLVLLPKWFVLSRLKGMVLLVAYSIFIYLVLI